MDSAPLLEHLTELVKRLRRIATWVFIGACVGYYFSPRWVALLQEPLLAKLTDGKLVFTTPFEKLWVYLRIAMIGGIAMVLPLIGFELASFVKPGLNVSERRKSKWLILSTTIAFVVGVFLGYRFVLPAILEAVLKFGNGTELPFLTLSAYVNTALGILLFCALFMQIPVWMWHLSAWGWVEAGTWAGGRKTALVVNAVVSAFLSPPDAVSMLLMMLPLQVLYEFGILGARVAQWLGNEKKSSETQTPSESGQV